MDNRQRARLLDGLRDGGIVPYLGPGVLADVVSATNGAPMPATGEQMIVAMNGGKPMSPKLMYEFSRAAMHVELKRGRPALTRFLDTTYGGHSWTRAAAHDWLRTIRPAYAIDINRDAQLIDSYAGVPHTLILGCARLGGGDYRFRSYANDGVDYAGIPPEEIRTNAPVLFKPMGAPRPKPSYVASDADYVDYITELMGGFGIPAFVKRMRRGKRYLLLGMRLTRDTERMVLADMIHDAATPAGWALIENATVKERRFLGKKGIELIDGKLEELISET